MLVKGLPVSYHINSDCNMECKYCFAKFDSQKVLSKQESLTLIKEISKVGFGKISFAGGEPTLCEWLPEMIEHSKKCGLVTMIVTNGTGLTEDFLRNMRNSLDWIGLSVDSPSPNSIKAIGKQVKNGAIDENYYFDKVDKINNYGYKLKINTVVSAVNVHEDLSNFINYAKPLRWKLFQMFPLKNKGIKNIEAFSISNDDLIAFYKKHLKHIHKEIEIVLENNDAMINSYIMIDPLGRFFNNTKFEYHYSQPILEVGIKEAFNKIAVDVEKMQKRNAVYGW